MGTRAAIIPFIFAVALFGAAFLFSATPAAAAGRDSVARGIVDMVTQRLCDRQAALGGRIQLIHPSKCVPTPPPPGEPTVTLSASPTTIANGESTTLTWSSTNATSCTAFLGWTGAKATSGSTPVSPTQTTTYQLDCTGPGGVGSDDATVTVTVVNPTQPSVDISAEPMTITLGSSATLTWNSDNATSCTASNGWSGSKSLDGNQSVSPTVTTTYAISCTGAGGTANDSVTVTVSQPEPDDPTLDLTATPTTINEGSSSLLSWSTTNATSCQKSGGWSGATTTSGTFSVSPTATTTYSMECTGAGGSATDSVTVNVVLAPEEPDAPTVDLVAAPTSVTPGAGSATTTLTWTTTNATSCTASGGTFTGSKAVNSSEIITPSATTTYTLECTGAGGNASDTVTVNFVPTPEEPSAGSDVVINEIAWMGSVVDGATSTAAATNAEWIELRNLGNNPVSLLNWSLVATDGTPNILISNACTNTSVPANGYYLLVRTNPTVLGVTADCSYTGAISNTTEIFTLFNAASSTIDVVDGGSNWEIGGAPTKGNNATKDTAQRADNDTWHTAVPTPKAVNN